MKNSERNGELFSEQKWTFTTSSTKICPERGNHIPSTGEESVPGNEEVPRRTGRQRLVRRPQWTVTYMYDVCIIFICALKLKFGGHLALAVGLILYYKA